MSLHSVPAASNRSSLVLDAETIEQLRNKWREYIMSQSKSPIELQLAKAREDRALELARSKRKAALELKKSIPKSCRPLTDLYNSPRTTSRMKQVLEKRMRPFQNEEPKSQYNLCPRCGPVKNSIINHKNAEQRLKLLLEQHPSLRPPKIQWKSKRNFCTLGI
ncbi:uncharacterized protein LOC108092611 [Drosophila ficusphila]|uniref:uncharacterized protein LOC108092611 n=1 Tax=Drosophila ficusphila TaxID=30025 RepID=UPI0007E5F085|nr:uncharacterized protein LOC108092611 [Drosophila ficusphila]